jgi:capsular polysaccharide biosynthesis protein
MEEQLPTRTQSENAYSQPVVVEEEEKGISLADIWRMIVKHWKGLGLFTLAGILAAGVYAFAIKKPVWSSTGTAIVLVKNPTSSGTETDGFTNAEYNYSLQLATTCAKYVMGSDTVYKAIVEDVKAEGTWGTEFTVNGMKKLVSATASATTSSLTSSPVVTVTASTSNAEFSKFLVDSMLENGIDYASTDDNYKALFGTNGVKLVNYATTPTDTSMSKFTIVLIGLAAGLVAGVAYSIIFEVADTHVVSSKEIEADTGVKVIGIVPDIEAAYGERKHKKGKRHHAA